MAEWHRARAFNAARLREAALSTPGLRVPTVPEHVEHAWYRYYVFVEPKQLKRGWNRDRVIHEIAAKGIPCLSGSCPEIYLEKAFDHTGFRPKERLSVARLLGETSLMFLVHPTLKEIEIDKTCEVLHEVMTHASS